MKNKKFTDRIIIEQHSFYSIMTGDEKYLIAFKPKTHAIFPETSYDNLIVLLQSYVGVINGRKWKLMHPIYSKYAQTYKIIHHFTDETFLDDFVEYLI